MAVDELTYEVGANAEVLKDEVTQEKLDALLHIVRFLNARHDSSQDDKFIAQINTEIPLVQKGLKLEALAYTSISILSYLNAGLLHEKGQLTILALADDLTNLIDNHPQHPTNDIGTGARDLIRSVLKEDGTQQQEYMREYLLKSLPTWKNQGKFWNDLCTDLFKNIPPEKTEEMYAWMNEILNSPITVKSARIVLAILTWHHGVEENIREELKRRFFHPLGESYGLDFEELIEIHWAKSGCNSLDNLKMIFDLEDALPESEHKVCSTLVREYGLVNFARYSIDILKDLYKERDNKGKPYGIALYPLSDDDGAFYQGRRLNELYSELQKEGIALRIYEVGSKYQAARAMVKVERRYGPKNKPIFALIAGHGSPGSITLDDTENKGGEQNITTNNAQGLLLQSDFEGEGAKKLGDFLEKDADIILYSCRTGAEGGIAETMSESYPGHRVTGPIEPAGSSTTFHIYKEGNKFHLKVAYAQTEAKNYYVPKPI